MESSGIKLQSLIRKFKNESKLQTQKDISNYAFDLSNNIDIDTSMFRSSSDVNDMEFVNSQLTSEMEKFHIEPLHSTSEAISIPSTKRKMSLPYIHAKNDVDEYLGAEGYKGYLSNIYNAEYVTKDWAVVIYIMNMVSMDFVVSDKIKLKSLHIGSWSVLSALNHYIYNSCISYIRPEWNWLNIIDIDNNTSLGHFSKSQPFSVNYSYSKSYSYSNSYSKSYSSPQTIDSDLKRKYSNNLLYKLDRKSDSVNNLNFIINETSRKLTKINLLIANSNEYLSYAALTIKLMEQNGVFLLKIPNQSKWDKRFIHIMFLYSLLFQNVYVYKFDIGEIETYLLCKNKKKINNETVYKKLIFILNSGVNTDKLLFNDGVIPDLWAKKLTMYPIEDGNCVEFSSMLDSFNSLNMNTENFL